MHPIVIAMAVQRLKKIFNRKVLERFEQFPFLPSQHRIRPTIGSIIQWRRTELDVIGQYRLKAMYHNVKISVLTWNISHLNGLRFAFGFANDVTGVYVEGKVDIQQRQSALNGAEHLGKARSPVDNDR